MIILPLLSKVVNNDVQADTHNVQSGDIVIGTFKGN